MAAPADRLANVLAQDIGLNLLPSLEIEARRRNLKCWNTFPYADNREVAQTVQVDPQSSSATILNRRRLRVLCCFLNVPWNTSYNQTRTDLATAVGSL